MSEVKQILNRQEVERAIMSCLTIDYSIKLSYKHPYIHENDLSEYIKMRKYIAHQYFDGYLTDEQKDSLRKMFIEVNKKIARHLNIITEE